MAGRGAAQGYRSVRAEPDEAAGMSSDRGPDRIGHRGRGWLVVRVENGHERGIAERSIAIARCLAGRPIDDDDFLGVIRGRAR